LCAGPSLGKAVVTGKLLISFDRGFIEYASATMAPSKPRRGTLFRHPRVLLCRERTLYSLWMRMNAIIILCSDLRAEGKPFALQLSNVARLAGIAPHTDLLPHMLSVDGAEARDHSVVYELHPENLELCFTEPKVQYSRACARFVCVATLRSLVIVCVLAAATATPNTHNVNLIRLTRF
jgi:hypothetical protein